MPMQNTDWRPDVTVAAICEQDGRFLLVEELAKSTQQVVFNQPAGHIEQGETVLQAVIRETLEETQCHFTPKGFVGFYRLEAETNKTYFRYTFFGEVSEPDLSQSLDQDIIRTHWLSLEEIQRLSNLRSPLVLACIQDYLANKHFPLDIMREL